MRQENAVDGFRPTYVRTGQRAGAPAVLMLHGWPGDRTDFNSLDLCTDLVDGRPEAVRSYLRYFWSHWSGPGYPPASNHLDHLVSVYGQPGAFAASIAWYRAGAGSVAVSAAESAPDPGDRIAVPATVLWPSHDPLFPFEWSDRLAHFFAAPTLTRLDGAGHFTPLERPRDFAAAVNSAVG